MAGRTILSYYDIDRNRWCESNGSAILERHFPYFNLYETPVLVINLINSDADPVTILPNSTFQFVVTDMDYAPIAVPMTGGVNNEADYEDVDPDNGIFSFRLNFATEEAEDLLDGYRSLPVLCNLNIIDVATSYNINISPLSLLNTVYRSTATIIPVGTPSQYRINPNDGGTDVWDYGTSVWMRPVLNNGVLSYYPAPVAAFPQYRINPNDGGTDIWDYGTSSWMRSVLNNGIPSYYPAP
jgi:hypothetical protein